MQDDEAAELNDILDTFGLGVTPVTREDEVYNKLTEGSAPKIDNCRVMLTHQMAIFHFLTKKENRKITADSMVDGKAVPKQLNNVDYAKLILKFYLCMYHLPWFMDLNTSAPKASLSKVIDMLLEHDRIKEAINKKW